MSTTTINLVSMLSQVPRERNDSSSAASKAAVRASQPTSAADVADRLATRESASTATTANENAQSRSPELTEALERVSRMDHRLSFTVDEDSGKSVVVVRDARTSEVLKQFPSEEMLNVARRLEEHLQSSGDGAGVLHSDEA